MLFRGLSVSCQSSSPYENPWKTWYWPIIYRNKFGPFVKKGFSSAILQESANSPNLIKRLHSLLKDFNKTRKPSFIKPPTRVFAYTCSLTNVFYVNFRSICQIKSIGLKKISIILYYISMFVGRGWEFFQKMLANVEK